MEHFLEKFLHGNLGIIVGKKHYKDFLNMLPQHICWEDGDLQAKLIPYFDEVIFFCEYRKEKPFLVCIPSNVIWCLPEAKKDLIAFDKIVHFDKDTLFKEKNFDKSIMDFLR